MAQENITVKLPGSGGVAEIRSYVKNKDRRAIRRAALASKEFDQKEMEANKDGEVSFKIKGDSLTDILDLQIKCLLVAYDGNTEDPFAALEDSEYEEDMEAVENAVKAVFDKGSSEGAEKKSTAGKATTTAR